MSEETGQPEQSIEELQKRYTQLNTRKIQAETKLDEAEKQLKQLKSQAKEKYKTDDIDELRKMLDKMKTENEEKRREYQENLDRIESDLNSVDEKFAAATNEDQQGDVE